MAHTHDPADTHEQRQDAYLLEVRAKYTAAEIEEMGKSGHAFKNDDGSYSYPIGDEADLKNAIHAVGRGNSDHDAIRKYILGRAKDLGADDLIPSTWNSDGSIEDDEAKSDDAATQCSRCEGSGEVDLGAGAITCPNCSGSGELSRSKLAARAIRDEYRNEREIRNSSTPQFELREVPNGTGGTNLRFTGFASVTGDDAAYEMEDFIGPWTESVNSGAFKKTLSDGADVAFLLNHQGMTLARTKPGTLKLSEETDGTKSPVYGVTGLHSEADLDPTNMYVQAMRSAVDRGDLDEMSFAFRVLRQEWNKDYTRRWINEVSLDKGDVSLVNYGANPTTGGTVSMRQKLGIRDTGEANARLVAVVKDLRLLHASFEIREGKVLSSANQSKLQEALDALHAADDEDIPGIVRQLQAINEAVDAGQAALSIVLSVADPDGDPKDLQPTLTPPEAKSLVPFDSRADRVALEAMRYAPRRAS